MSWHYRATVSFPSLSDPDRFTAYISVDDNLTWINRFHLLHHVPVQCYAAPCRGSMPLHGDGRTLAAITGDAEGGSALVGVPIVQSFGPSLWPELKPETAPSRTPPFLCRCSSSESFLFSDWNISIPLQCRGSSLVLGRVVGQHLFHGSFKTTTDHLKQSRTTKQSRAIYTIHLEHHAQATGRLASGARILRRTVGNHG